MREREITGCFRQRLVEANKPGEDKNYVKTLELVDDLCSTYNLDHRFVGGSFTDFLSIQTQMTINCKAREILLINPSNISLRNDDKCIKDIDLLTFTSDYQALSEATETFGQWTAKAKEYGYPFPRISVKPIRYPGWPSQGLAKEFMNSLLSNLHVDENGNLFVNYCDVTQQIPWETVQAWRLKLGEKTGITTFHPYAHALTYGIFIPGESRKKDRQVRTDPKVGKQYSKNSLLFRFAQESIDQGLAQGINYEEMYKSWPQFVRRVRTEGNWLTKAKLEAIRGYWETIGTSLSHGKGFPSRVKDKISEHILAP